MSTNYYAHIKLGGRSSVETTIAMHIGKTGSNATIFSGDWFSSFAEWCKFLEFNADKIDIRDEYGQEMTLDALTERFESYGVEERRSQFDWIGKNSPESMKDQWLDPEGYTFSRGEFF